MLQLMVGRPLKTYPPLFHEIIATMEDKSDIPMGSIPVLCPDCGSACVGPYGFQRTLTGNWQKFQCKNEDCPSREHLKKGRQFVLKTSAIFKEALAKHLSMLLIPLIKGDTPQTALAAQHHRSSALMTYIRHKVEGILAKRQLLEKLVIKAPYADAVSLDELFLKIDGIPVYVIMATAYGKRQVLGVKVTFSRDEIMMRHVFNEAEQNNGKPFSMITIDAWGGSIKMAKNLMRPITLVVHKHKAPYNKAVLWKIEYEPDKRITHKIGVKTDFFRTRKVREYYYLKEVEDLSKPLLKQKGRPKEVKNGQGKGPYLKIPKEEQKTRGPKGLFALFEKGHKGYAHVDPGKKLVRIAKGGSSTVAAVLNQVILVYGKMTIQNNLAENKNSVVEHRVWRSGPKELLGFEQRLRCFLFYLNNPEELPNIQIDHNLRGDLVYDELKCSIFGDIWRQAYQFQQKVTKMEE